MKTAKPESTPEPEAIDDSDFSTSQETKPLPIIYGTEPVALTWISPVYNQKAEPAPSERPGKK